MGTIIDQTQVTQLTSHPLHCTQKSVNSMITVQRLYLYPDHITLQLFFIGYCLEALAIPTLMVIVDTMIRSQ